jgi:hypothetical protein
MYMYTIDENLVKFDCLSNIEFYFLPLFVKSNTEYNL